jgi:hypothetical protein
VTDLHGGTDAIEIGSDIYVRAPGLVGSVDLVQAVVLGTRSGEESATPTLVGALARQELTVRYSVEIAAAPAGTGAPQTNRGADGRPQLTLEVPAVGSDQTQVALLADEAGVVTWHYAQPGTLQNLVRFDVPADAVATVGDAPGGATRGLVSVIGKKLLSVLVFPILEAGAEVLARRLAEWWENQHRRPGLRRFAGPQDRDTVTPIDGDGWNRLSEGKALLFVHGTFSTSQGGFGALPADAWGALNHRYGGRLFAYDHPSLSVDPLANVAALQRLIPSHRRLDVDVVTHSRGGLVARALACESSDPSFPVRVGSVVHVGAPNAGTKLADVSSHAAFIDRMCSLLNLAPDGPLSTVADILDGVLTVVKIIGCNGIGQLPGLAPMDPNQPWLRELGQRRAPPHKAYAIGSNYEPKGGVAKLTRVPDSVADRIFGESANDIIVPAGGVYDVPAATGFPIPADQRVAFDAAESVWHCGYFGQPKTAEALLNWLPG